MGRQTVPSSTAPLATHLDNKQDGVLQNNDNQPVKTLATNLCVSTGEITSPYVYAV